MKNKNKIFFVLALLVLVLTISTVSAADDANTTTDTPIVSDDSTTSINAEVQTNTKEKVVDTKTIEKEDKKAKTAIKNVEVNNYDEIKTAMDNIVNEEGNDIYVINLNDGTYEVSSNIILSAGAYEKNIILNANNQILTGAKLARYVRFNNTCNNTINNAIITHRIQNYANLTLNNININNTITNNGQLTFNNCTLNSNITNSGVITIDDDVFFNNNCQIIGEGSIIINDTSRIADYVRDFYGEYTFNGVTISNIKNNYGNITFNNSTLNATINNRGILIISDDTVLAENFNLDGEGEVVINDTSKLLPLNSEFNGTYTFTNRLLPNIRYNHGNLTLINCTLESSYLQWGMTYYNNIENTGNLSLINCTLNCGMNNTGDLFIEGSNLPSGTFTNYGLMDINDVCWPNSMAGSSNYYALNCYSDVVIRNSTFYLMSNDIFVYSGNLSIQDCQFIDCSGGFIGNTGNASITLINTTMKNNKKPSGTFRMIPTISMINCTFENNNNMILSANNTVINNCIFENNSNANIIESNETYINNSIFKNQIDARLLKIQSNCNITNCTFENNSLSSRSSGVLLNGVAINLLPHGNNDMIITGNVFKNNYISAVEGVITGYYNPVDCTRNGYGTDISLGVDYQSNDFVGSNNKIIISKNQFINSQTTQKAGAIFVNFNETCENNSLEINDNTFENVKSKSETIIHNNTENVLIENNKYINCTIDLDEFSLSSPQEGSIIATGNEILLNIVATLTNPNYYDADILNYEITINDTNIINTTDNTYTYVPESYGTLDITVNSPTFPAQSNNIIIHVNKYDITLNPITTEIISNTDLSAIVTINDEKLDSGRVYFTFNGKILRDSVTGKILYADVNDGVAILTGVNVTKAWNENSQITAVYQANNQIPSFASEEVTPTITTPEDQPQEFTVSDATASSGEEVNITVTVKNVEDGKVVLKVNGKILKASDGKLYAKVTGDTITFTYNVPKTYKAGNYTIKAVYTSGATKLESESVLTIE